MELNDYLNINGSRLLEGIEMYDLRVLFEQNDILTLRKGETLIHEGQLNDRFYIVLSGGLQVFLPRTEERGMAIRIRTLSPGDTVGEFSFFDGQPRIG